MNKVYKIIWSKAKNCYVVASELAKNHTKAPKSGIMNHVLVAGVLACVLSCSAVMPVYAEIYTAGGGIVDSNLNGGRDHIVIGTGAHAINVINGVDDETNNMIVIGDHMRANGEGSIAIGATWQTEEWSSDDKVGAWGAHHILMGENTYTSGYGNVSLGALNRSVGEQLVNIGTSSKANGNFIINTGARTISEGNYIVNVGSFARSLADGSTVIGNSSVSFAEGGTTLGSDTGVYENATNSVAIGKNSNAVEADVVSFGHKKGEIWAPSSEGNTNGGTEVVYFEDDYFRRLTNVADGVGAHDVVTKGQLDAATAYYGVNSTGGTNVDGSGATGANAIAIGKNAAAETNGGVAIGNNAHIYATEDEGAGMNLAIGDSAVSYGGMAVGQHTQVGTFENRGDNSVAVGTQTKVYGKNSAGFGVSALVDADISRATALGTNAHVSASNAVALGADSVADVANTVSVGSATKQRKIVNVADGVNDHDATTMEQLNNRTAYFGVNKSFEGWGSGDGLQQEYRRKMFGVETQEEYEALTNVGNYTGNGASAPNSVAIGMNAKASGQRSVAMGTGSKAGNASVAIGMLGNYSGNNAGFLVAVGSDTNDTTLYGNTYDTVGSYTVSLGQGALSTKSGSIAMGHDTVANGNSSLALGEYSVSQNRNEVSFGHNADDVKWDGTAYGSELNRKLTHVAEGVADHDAVAMMQLKAEALERSTEDALLDSRVGAQTDDGNYIKKSATNSVAQNVAILDTELKNVADSVSDELDTKADVNLSNITEAGETVIKNLSKGSVNVKGADKATVTKTDELGVDTYTVSVKANGQIAEGNADIVSGGTVYSALQEQQSDMETALDTKANKDASNVTNANAWGEKIATGSVAEDEVRAVSGNTVYQALQSQQDAIDTALEGKANIALDNITDDGKTVVRDLAKESVKVIAGSYTTVTEGTDSNAKTYAVNVRVNGQVAENNNGIVTGNTVYEALEQQKNALDTAIDGKANVELDNLADEGHAVIKADAKSVINVVGGEYATVTKSNQSGVDTYTVDVATDGVVEEGNDKLVKGDTVYQALQEQQTGIDVALAGKANVDASNVMDAEAWGQKIATGTVEENDEKAVSGKTVFTELRPDDGNYVEKTKTTAENLIALDTQIKTNADKITTNTNDITNLKDLSNITDAGKTVIKNLSKGSVNVIGADKATVTKTDQEGVDTYTVSVKADGEVAEGNENIVSGGAVYTALQNQQSATDTSLEGKANVDASNVTNANAWGTKIATGRIADGDVRAVSGDTVHTVLQEQQNAMDSALAEKANVDASNVTDANAWGEKIATGTVAEGDVRAISGDTLHTVLQRQQDTVNVALEGKANTDLGNITDSGHTVIKTDAKSAINVVGGNYATVDKTDVSGVDTYTVNVDTSGQVAEGNDKLVTGGTVYQALAGQQTAIDTALERKANVDASNVTDATAWAEKIGTGSVAPDNNELVTGKKVAEETRVASDGAYVSRDKTAGENISTLDVQIKANADAIASLGDDKANKDLDNVTDAGKEVIRELAKGSVKVVNGTHTTVTEGTDGDMKTYAVNVATDGTVTENNEGIVTGGTVYRAIENAKDTVSDDVDSKLEGYAKVDGSNVTTPATWGQKLGTGTVAEGNGELVTGDTVYQTVKTLAEVTADVLDLKANSDASNVGKNADTDNSTAWGEALGTGTVSDGDKRLVTGETIYKEVRPSTDGDYIKGTNTTAENLQVLDTQVSQLNTQLSDLATESQDFVKYDGTDHSKVTLGGANGTVITNVADGILSETSTDAVTGKQLYATNQEIETIKGTLTENGTKIDELRTDVNTLQTDVSELRTEYDVTKEQVATGFDVQTDGTKVKTVNPDSNVINFASGNHVALSNDNGSVKIDVVDDGQIAEGNTGLVTGGTVYQAIEEMNIPGALDTKANKDMDNLSDTGKDVVRNLAKGSVNVVGKDEIKVEKTSENDVDTYTVHIEPNGQISEGNTGLVTGDTVYNTIQQLGEEYARKDASNVDTQVWGEKLGDGAIDSSDGKLVSGKTVAQETRVATNGNYVQQSNTAGQNLSELDRVLKETRDIAEAAALTGTDTDAVHYDGADKEIITLVGNNGTVITNLKDGELSANSKDAVTGKQLFETNEKVAENTEKITALTDKVGTVSDGNYVNGNQTIGESIGALDTQLKTVSDGLDTVRNDVDALRDTMTEGLDGKSNTDLSNITEAGKTVISDIAKDSVKVKGSGLATVTSAEEGQAMVYTVDVQANGVVEEGNTGLVNGGTVYNSIQEVRNDFTTDLGGKANVDLSNLTDAGKDIIRETMQGDLDKKADKVDLETKANVDASNIDTKAWQEALGDGVIEEGNTGLINGSTAFRAIQEIKDNEVVKADFENGVIRLANEAKYDEIDVIDVSKSDGSSRVMTGVATNPNDPTSVANVGYVNAVGQVVLDNMNERFEQVDNKMGKVGASAAAMASLPMPPMDGDEKWAFSAAVGHYDSKTAGAVGAFYKPQDNVIVNVRGAVGNGEDMVGAGVGIALQRGNTPSVSKAQLVKTINAQAGKIQEQDARIAELEAVVAELVAKK